MVLDEVPVINPTHCMNALVKIHILKTRMKKKQPLQSGLDIFFTVWWKRLYFVGRSSLLSHLLVSHTHTKKTITPIHCDVRWVSESSLNFPVTCSGKTVSQQNHNARSFAPKEDLKEVLLLMSLRATRVYKHSHWSQVSFKHQTDPKALHSFPEEALRCSMSSFPFGEEIWAFIAGIFFKEISMTDFPEYLHFASL